MALAISPIKDASFLRVMAALQNGALLGTTPSKSASTSNPSDSITAEDTGIIDLNMWPNMLRQQDEYDMQAVSDISKRFGIPSPNTGEEFSTHTDIPQNGMLTTLASTADLFTEADKQEKLEANNIARRFGVPSPNMGEEFSTYPDGILPQTYDSNQGLYPDGILPQTYDINYLKQLFEANKDKNFVQRVLYPEKSLITGKNSIATHKMGYSTIGEGKARMYPTVVEQMGELVQLDPKTAYNYAVANKEFIDLPEDAAKWVSENYKTLWGDTSTTPKETADSNQGLYPDGILPQTPQPTNNQSTAKQPPVVTPQGVQPVQGKSIALTQQATAPMDDVLQNTLHARIDALRQSSPDLLTQQQLLHLEDMIPMDVKGAEAIITGLESQAKAMGNNRGPFGGGYNQYLETLSHVEQGEREVVEKYKKLFEDRGIILKDKPTPNWFMLAAGLMIGGKGGAAFLNGYTQSYQARYQNERNSKLQIIEDQMKALEMDAKMLGSEENFSKARLSVAADTAKILGQMKDTIMARYTVEKAPELQNLLKWEVQNTLDKNGEYTQLTFPKLQEYMLATKIAKTPKEAEVAARIYVAYKQDSIQKLSSQMLHNIWSTNLQTAAIEQRKSGKITNQDTLVPSEYINFSIPQSTKESQIPTTMLTRFQSAGTLPVLSKVAQLISTGVIPLSVTSTPYELTAGLPSEIKNDEVYKKSYGGNPNLLLKDVNTMFTAFNSSINIPKLQEEVTTNTGKMTSAYNNIMNYALKDLGTLSPESKSVIKTMVGKVIFSTPELINNPAVIKTFAQYLSKLKEEDIRKIATPTNIYDNIDYSSAILQVPDYFINFSKELTTEGSKWALVNANNNKNLSDSKNDTTIIKKSLNTIQSFKSGLDTILATTPTSILNMPIMGENVNIDDYTSFYTAAAKSALYGALAQSIPQEHPELRMYLGDSDAQTSSVFAKTKIDMRDEFTLYDTYANKTGTSFTDTINEYLTSMRISAIDLNNNYGMLAYSTSTTVPNQEAWYASKLQSPKIVALQSRIDELTNTLSASSDPINDVTTRANLRKLDQALKQYRELLLK